MLTGHDGIEGRLMSPLVSYDWKEMEVTTLSGRVYQLVGPSEPGSDDIRLIQRGIKRAIKAKKATPAVMRRLRMHGRSA